MSYVTRTETDGIDDVIIIEYLGEEVFRWYDNAACEYPEDLTWHRMIGDVFRSGVELGWDVRDNGDNTPGESNER